MLWQNLVFSLKELTGNLPELFFGEKRQIMIIDKTKDSKTAEVLVKFFLIGVASLENTYPKYVNYSVSTLRSEHEDIKLHESQSKRESL